MEVRRQVRGYRDLLVWQRAMDLVCATYALARLLPPSERFELTAQLRRSAVSIASNIAEGHGRGSSGHFMHHLSVARGSLTELETQVLIAERLGFTDHGGSSPVLTLADEVSRMLSGLMRSLRSRPAHRPLLAPRPRANPPAPGPV